MKAFASAGLMGAVCSLGLALIGLVHRAPVIRAGDNFWTPLGLFGSAVNAIAPDPLDPRTVYAGLSADGVWKSTDGGLSWSQKGIDGRDLRALTIDSNDPAIVYAATNRGLFKTFDGGESWALASLATVSAGKIITLPAESLAVSPLDSRLLLLGAAPGRPGEEAAPIGIWRSMDGGIVWNRVFTPGSNLFPHLTDIQFAPSAPTIAYAVSPQVGTLKSVDQGQTWQAVNFGFVALPGPQALKVDPADAQVVYLGTGTGGLFKTMNGGGSWVPISGGLGTTDIRAIAIYPSNQQVLFAGGGLNMPSGIPGVYRSFDNTGATWAPMMVGMDSRAIRSLSIDRSTPPNLYAGTNSGIWKYTIASGIQDYSVSINEGALFTNQTAVTLTLTAPPGTTEMLLSNDGGFGDANFEPFVGRKTWTITALGSAIIPRIVYARFRTGGQVSGQYQDDIILDFTPPTGSIQIAPVPASALNRVSPMDLVSATLFVPLATKSYRPGYATARLALTASDDASGVSSMLIANDASFSDAKWQPFQPFLDWYVPLDQPLAIFVKFRDRAGNQSVAYSTEGQ